MESGQTICEQLSQVTATNLVELKCVKILAFTGFKGAGKTTACEIVNKERLLGADWKEYNFGDKLKNVLQHLFGFNPFQMRYEKEIVDQFWNFTPRHALQKVGTEIVRDLLPGILGLPDSKPSWTKSRQGCIQKNIQCMLWLETFALSTRQNS